METLTETLAQAGMIIGLILVSVAGFSLMGLLFMIRRIRQLQVPPMAGYFTTMHYVPLSLCILLDLLDLALDVFSAPITWIVLDRMGLRGLRDTAAVEGLLPFTGPIPLLTISWLLARTMGMGHPAYDARARATYDYANAASRARQDQYALEDYEDDYADDHYDHPPRQRRRPTIIDADPVE